MNKKELIDAMATKSNLSKKDTEIALKSFVETVQEAVLKGEKVQLVGFGTFGKKERAERTGKNPRTQEPITIPAKTVASFKAGKEFNDLLKK